MSTRATYSFLDVEYQNVNTCVYIHYDGYPKGAALYFYTAITKPSKGNFATQFVRANEQAEITKGHTVHSDTDYRYYVTGNGLDASILAYRMTYGENSDKKKELVFMGTVKEFINKYNELIEDFSPFKTVYVGYTNKILNLDLAKIEINHLMSHLKVWEANFQGTCNWNSCVDDIGNVITAFPELMTEEVDKYISLGKVKK